MDWVSVGVLAVAVAVLGWDQLAGEHTPIVYVPMLQSTDPPGSLRAPDADVRAIRATAAAIGEVVTIEDLVRVVVALEEGRGAEVGMPDAPPLTEAERAALAPLLARARADRDALLAVEAELQTAEVGLRGEARQVAGSLTPEQRAWVQANRDQISVGQVEDEYWDRASGDRVGADPAGGPE